VKRGSGRDDLGVVGRRDVTRDGGVAAGGGGRGAAKRRMGRWGGEFGGAAAEAAAEPGRGRPGDGDGGGGGDAAGMMSSAAPSAAKRWNDSTKNGRIVLISRWVRAPSCIPPAVWKGDLHRQR